MATFGYWLSPLLLLPGTALLILSTAARFTSLHDEIHLLLKEKATGMDKEGCELLQRAKMFRNALIFLYSAVVLFALGGLSGGLTSFWPSLSRQILLLMTVPGILCLLLASLFLLKESTIMLKVIRSHVRELDT